MKRFHYALITAAFAALLLSACGSADTDTAGSSGDNFLVVLNYGKYLDSSAIKMFEQETGIKIKLEEYESPEEMYTKFSAGSISYDVVRTSDYMVERLIHEGKVAPIDFSSFSYYKNLDPAILAAAEVFDPQNQYSMPYFYGTLGILYNTTMVSEEETESSEDEAVVSSTEKQYTLTTPTVQTITEASASQVTDGLYSLYANQIAAVNPTEEQLAEYGLDEPYSVVSVSIDGVEQFTLRASERNSNNYVYMTKDGSPFVYLVSASRLSWLTVQVEQLTQSVYEPVELDELSSLTVESADQSYTFLVTQGEEQTVTGNGEEVDSELFAELYRTITAIPPDELSSGEPSLEKVLTMTVRYLDEGRQEDVFELYPTGDGNVYISLNGEIRYTVSQDVVYQILDNCQNVLDGKEVSALA